MARKPPQTFYRPPTTVAYYGWDSLGDVHTTLSQLERGDFRQAAIMFDAMMRDDRASAVMQTRLLAPQTLALDLKAPPEAAENKKAVALAEKLGGVEDGPGLWDVMYPAEELAELRYWGIGLGIGVGQQTWITDEDSGLWLPRLRVWHPQHLRWDESRQRYVIRQYAGAEIILPNVHENPRSDGEWILYCPYGYNEAWRKMTICRGIAETVLDRKWNRIDWSRLGEKWGKPIEKLKVPATMEQAKKDTLFDNLASRHGESVVLCDVGRDGEGNDVGVDVVLEEMKGQGWDIFQARKEANDRDLAVRVLGQNSTTEVADGKGSMALPGAELVRQDILVADTGITVPLRFQGLMWVAEMNGIPAKFAPVPKYRTEPPADEVAKSQAKLNTATMISAFKSAGSPINERAEMEEAGVAAISVEEIDAEKALVDEATAAAAEVQTKAGVDLGAGEPPAAATAAGGVKLTPSAQGAIISVNEARASSGLGPLLTDSGEHDPEGSLSIADYQAKHAAIIAEAANAAAGDAGAKATDAPADDTADDEKKKRPQKFSAMTLDTLALCARVEALAGKKPVPAVAKRYQFQGLDIAVENPKGSTRQWPGGSTRMQHDYGYIEGHMAWDDDEVDVYVGHNEKAPMVHVVHQLVSPTYDRYDEDKVFVGFDSQEAALRAYAAHRNDGHKAVKSVSSMSVSEFHRRLAARKGSGPIRASAKVGPTVQLETRRALTALAAKVRASAVALRAAPTPAKRRSFDRLTENATRIATNALAPFLAAVKDEIPKASGFEDLQARLLARFKHASPDQLAEVVFRTRMMAQLTGMLSAHKETKKK